MPIWLLVIVIILSYLFVGVIVSALLMRFVKVLQNRSFDFYLATQNIEDQLLFRCIYFWSIFLVTIMCGVAYYLIGKIVGLQDNEENE